MIRVGVVGLGKMGLSHFAIVNAHPMTEVVVCDQSGVVLDALKRYTKTPVYKSYEAMLDAERLDAVIIATPSKSHAGLVRTALERGLHVFCEKPFCLDWQDAKALSELAEDKGLVNQVGYHYRFVEPFHEVKRLIDSGALGTVTHVMAEAYGPVVLRPKGTTWRTNAVEGGGCLYDYAAHPINLVNWYFGVPEEVSGTVMNAIFSAQTEDEVYSTFTYPGGMSVHLSTNWSDESYRKMTTKMTVSGTKGRLFADRLECQVYLRETDHAPEGYEKGWNIRYLTDFGADTFYYLRGEEYSGQIDAFVKAVANKTTDGLSTFRSAAMTDYTMMLMRQDAGQTGAPVKPQRAGSGSATGGRSWFARR